MPPSPSLRASLALLALAALPACPRRGPADPARMIGVYEARLPAADAVGRIVTLWLEPDAVATLDTVYVGKGRAPVLRGRWSVGGDELTVVLASADGVAQAPLVWTVEERRLVPKAWDRGVYGELGLPLGRR